jgi:hypothetical protein
MELLSGHEQIITNSGISLNAGTLNRGFTVTNYIDQSTSCEANMSSASHEIPRTTYMATVLEGGLKVVHIKFSYI